ncbi:hypothetical protein POVWA2_030530 [Plasmodium ovale wallikeri]|uniref:Uncharacterized protein n=1 Tax=Plasmodium ovale wallikeri TaxID=864142 RepID=A0A1A8YY01_PLAOA|nr:hypothetical protein POVWA1_017100 [Plasmodium ovale wallikeri]SBT36487.1 hypothetical protein POVWA2_030530 [Plasmodium ovale wallikeri]
MREGKCPFPFAKKCRHSSLFQRRETYIRVKLSYSLICCASGESLRIRCPSYKCKMALYAGNYQKGNSSWEKDV